MTATFTDLILRVILAFLLAPRFGAAGIWMSWPLGWAVAAALSLGFYFTGGWRKRGGQHRQIEKTKGAAIAAPFAEGTLCSEWILWEDKAFTAPPPVHPRCRRSTSAVDAIFYMRSRV
jgi:hypothetical protein